MHECKRKVSRKKKKKKGRGKAAIRTSEHRIWKTIPIEFKKKKKCKFEEKNAII